MKTRNILFTGAMVRAILSGKKTQTRRLMKPSWGNSGLLSPREIVHDTLPHSGRWLYDGQERKCPYGVPGDRLRIRESVWIWGRWAPNGTTKTGRPKRKFVPLGAHHRYVADCPQYPKSPPLDRKIGHSDELWVKRPAIFMPSWACRTTLELADIRIEPLAEASRDDCIAEGIEQVTSIGPCRAMGWKDYGGGLGFISMATGPRESYQTLWESINGVGSWDENPWVWVLGFKVVPV